MDSGPSQLFVGNRGSSFQCSSRFAVRPERGGPWDWSRDLREQDGWDEHARFMDSLVDDGFILLEGPLGNEREILHVICATFGL
jgi:hypothetical protein